ncbi:MAG TPA: hypothetical protein DEQ98_07730 [Acidobacteria bacterium]|nr:hypothetical protein [Acidobacteriota bacterium]
MRRPHRLRSVRTLRCVLVFGVVIVSVACTTPAPDTEQPVSQPRNVDVGVTARIHINTQTTDFARARAFYRMLGFTAGVGGFPKTNTHLMARSLGMYDLCTYELQAIEVIAIPESWGPSSIDLIQFAVPFSAAPPYASPTHLGMAYAALLTTDLAADVAHLTTQDVEFLSEPYGVPGDRFVFFTDPDGVLYKLVETAPPHGDPEADMHVTAMPYIGLNVSDFDRSLAYYQMLGYTDVRPLGATGALAEARAYGLDTPFTRRGADIALPGGDQHRLRRGDDGRHPARTPPYPPPINHVGIARMALAVRDLDRAVSVLQQHGAEFLSEIAPCCSGTGEDTTGIINLIDPDGIYIELVGPIERRDPIAPPEWCEAR